MVAVGEPACRHDVAAGQQGLDENADGEPLGGHRSFDALGGCQPGPDEFLRLGQAAAAVADVAQECLALRQVGAAPPHVLALGHAFGEELLGPPGLVAVHEQQGDRRGHLEAAVLVGPAHPAAQGLLGISEGGSPRLAAHEGVPRPQTEDVALLQAPARQLVRKPRQSARAGGRVGLVGAERAPHEVIGLHAQFDARIGGAPSLVGGHGRGLGQPVGVGQRLGQPVDDGGAQVGVDPRLRQRLSEMADGGRGLDQESGAGQLVEKGGAVLCRGRFPQRPGQHAPGGLRSPGAQILTPGGAQACDRLGPAVAGNLQQVPGGDGGIGPHRLGGMGGRVVHADPQARRDVAVDRRGDLRVDELQAARGLVGVREDAPGAQLLGRLDGLLAAEYREVGGDLR
ncbi:hypothetical protein SAFG77S_04514 [Streptomyces afghaniensis]